jgi:hypothetical protein
MSKKNGKPNHRVYEYKNLVKKTDIKIIEDDENNKRYLLEIPLHNQGIKSVLVILKNPSKANKYVSDLTVDRILTFCHNEGYSKVYVMNLFSYYSTEPNRITQLIDDGRFTDAIGDKNNQILKEVLDIVDEVIVAWGGNSIHRKHYYMKRINDVINIINGKKIFYVQSISKDGYYPRHAQVWSVKKAIKKYRWTIPNSNQTL